MNKYIITIARQYGSDGHKIGKLLAEKLNYEFLDKELLNIIAKDFDYDKSILEHYDEKSPGKFYSMVTPSMSYNGSYGSYGSMYNNILVNDELMRLQTKILQEKALENSLVVVGRCGDYIFREKPRLIKVFVYCDEDVRSKRLIEEHNIPKNEVKNVIKKSDKNRSNYYFTYTDKKWGVAKNYDLCINTAKISIPQAVKLIIDYKKDCFGE